MKIYMTGIGGVGMSALAQLYLARGDKVSGYDRVHGPTTDLLEEKGVVINYEDATGRVPDTVELLVYSDAIPESHGDRTQAAKLGIRQVSYFKALGEVSAGVKTLAVAGTHGKTTTTAMLTKILKDGGQNPTAIIGSIVKDFGSNFVAGDPTLFVVEACEYRDHLLEIDPKILVITNLEWDHTDWFHTEEAMVKTFHTAALKVPRDGFIVTNPSVPTIKKALEGVVATVIDYTKVSVPELNLIGEFNKHNARAAKAAALALVSDLDQNAIDESLKTFQGTWRRFEYKGKAGENVYVYDDYAHHPTAIKATLEAVRERFPDHTIVVAFHPHLYTRTRDLLDEFASAFGAADEVVLAPIYAAREAPIPGITSEVLAEKIGKKASAFKSLEEVETYLRTPLLPESVIITMGAGDIYKVAEKIVV